MLIIHPGFEKTGTTTLQETVFRSHPEIFNIGRPFNASGKKLGDLLHVPKEEYDDTTLEKIAKDVKTSTKTIVLSDEHLAKNFYMRSTVAARLFQHFPDAQIIFTIRNQIRAIESYYGNHGRVLKNVPAPFAGKFVTLENWLEYSWNNWTMSFLGLCDYNRTISIYRHLFGQDQINVLLFEQLRDDIPAFAEAVSDILQLDPALILRMLSSKIANPRDSVQSVIYSRWREKFPARLSIMRLIPFGSQLQRSFHQRLRQGRPFHVPVPLPWNVRLGTVYAEGNKEIAKDFGLPLARYGYPMNADTVN